MMAYLHSTLRTCCIWMIDAQLATACCALIFLSIKSVSEKHCVFLSGQWPRSKRHVMAWQPPKRATVMSAAGHSRDFVLFTAAQLSGAAVHSTVAGIEVDAMGADATAEASSESDAVQVITDVAAVSG
jgi:hypothetical protein